MRKVRRDKKREIQAFVSLDCFETISRISYITCQPMKDIIEYVCVQGSFDSQVIEYLSSQFVRDFHFNSSIIKIGNRELISTRTIRIEGKKKIISTRLKQTDYQRISDLAYSLDKTVASTLSLLLQAALKQPSLLNSFIETFIVQELSPGKKKELKKVIRFINKNNPYDEQLSLLSILNYICEDILLSHSTLNVKHAIHDFIDSFLNQD